MNKLKIIFVIIILTRCALPQFSFKSGGSEAKEINAKTVQVDYFDNKSAIGGSFLGASFTESLRDIMQSQTKLNLVAENGDLQISGVIKNYIISPVNIQAGSESAAQNRLRQKHGAEHGVIARGAVRANVRKQILTVFRGAPKFLKDPQVGPYRR